TDQCQMKPCTFDLPEWFVDSVTGCCIVAGGQCRVSTSINSEMLGTLIPGGKTGIEILGCGLKRLDGPSPPARLTFSCGGLAPCPAAAASGGADTGISRAHGGEIAVASPADVSITSREVRPPDGMTKLNEPSAARGTGRPSRFSDSAPAASDWRAAHAR